MVWGWTVKKASLGIGRIYKVVPKVNQIQLGYNNWRELPISGDSEFSYKQSKTIYIFLKERYRIGKQQKL